MSSPRVPFLSQEQQSRIDILARVASYAETVALDYFARREELTLENKSTTDFVTEADRAVERCIRSEIAKYYPADVVVGEELGGEQSSAYWLIDPIDGTSNFLSGLPLWSMSIAYVEDNHPTLGVVSIPMLGRCLLGGRAFGLHEVGRNRGTNGTPLAFGIGQNELWPTNRRDLIEAELRSQGLTALCLGSCATSLALVASGELAGYAEGNVGFWDIAAGVALSEAANVPVSFTADTGPQNSFVTAGPELIQPAIFEITQSQPNFDQDCMRRET